MKVANHSKIYEAILSHCVPLEVNGPWGRFAADVDAWTLASSPEEVLNSLQNNDSDEEPAGDSNQDAVAYSEEDLVTSHAAFRLHNGTLALSPRLTGPESVIVPLRVQPTEPPYDLLVADGTLSRNLPVCAALRDGVLQASIEALGGLLVTFSIDDLIVLRLAGLPVITATGLPNLAWGALDLFCKTYGLRDSAAPSDSDSDQSEADQVEVDFETVADAIQDEEPSTASPTENAGGCHEATAVDFCQLDAIETRVHQPRRGRTAPASIPGARKIPGAILRKHVFVDTDAGGHGPREILPGKGDMRGRAGGGS